MRSADGRDRVDRDPILAGTGNDADARDPRSEILPRRSRSADTILPRAIESFWFECKRDGGKQSRYQRDFQEMCEAAGEHYVLGGLAELTVWLERKGIIRLSFKDTWKATGS
jgi:hypothetical protein